MVNALSVRVCRRVAVVRTFTRPLPTDSLHQASMDKKKQPEKDPPEDSPSKTTLPSKPQNPPQPEPDPPASDPPAPDSDPPAADPPASLKSKLWKYGKFAIPAVVAGGASVVAAPLVIGALGFTSGGIAAGSIAAGWMSSTAIASGGGIASGSAVAILQGVGATGLSAGASAALGTGVATATAGVQKVGSVLSSRYGKPKNADQTTDGTKKSENAEQTTDDTKMTENAETKTKDAETQTEDELIDGSDSADDDWINGEEGNARKMTEKAEDMARKQPNSTELIDDSEATDDCEVSRQMASIRPGYTKDAECQTENTRLQRRRTDGKY